MAEEAVPRCALLRPAGFGDLHTPARVSLPARRSRAGGLQGLGGDRRDPETARSVERGAPADRVTAAALRDDRIERTQAPAAGGESPGGPSPHTLHAPAHGRGAGSGLRSPEGRSIRLFALRVYRPGPGRLPAELRDDVPSR